MNPLQLRASNPNISTWVSASAGTGKTKILTDRVLRLLLKNADFHKILCLTFTNAAAGEMKERIATSLAKWSNSTKNELANELYNTLGRNGTEQELEKAKKLYELYLRASERINIQTIHAFCQALLKRFPLEAGISPSFKIIDEAKSYSLLQQIKKNLLNKQELEPINNYLTTNFHETTIDETLTEIIQQKSKFLDKTENIYEESKKLIAALEENTDYKYQGIINHNIIRNIVGFECSVKQVKNFFLTKDGKKKKRIVSQKIAKAGSSLYGDLEYIQHQIYLLDQEDRSIELENHSKLLTLLGSNIIKTYENYKASKGLLDYDDLIIYAKELLKSSDAREWVLYKLDGGIDHLLVDEAQDTSASQWQIIEAMIEEFYSGDSANEDKNRTIFVVGDEKQSIFSFQGADITSFANMNQLLKQRMLAANKKFENVNLKISYRSAKEILEIVHKVFDEISIKMPGQFTNSITKLNPFRTEYHGSVELWPLCKSDNEDDDFWRITTHENKIYSTKTKLAKKISQYIKTELATGRVIPSTGNIINPSDFMILFRKRDELTHEVIQALKNENIEVAGLDRISLTDNLAVLDLLSVAKFALNTDDNLNLASLLKSPLIGISEEELYNLSNARKELSLWEYLQISDKKDICNKLKLFIDIFNQSDVSNFFQYLVDILGYREILNANCGPDSNDAIDELLYSCNNFASEENSSIQNFIFWLESYQNSIKRDNNNSDKIRIMTLHASKGLQAPFVILCDTNNIPTNSDRFLWDNDGPPLSAKKSTYIPNYYQELKEKKQQKAYAEYLRLLYVGMTRAEDHLVICGYQGGKKLPENCWYELVRSTMVKIARESQNGTLIYGQTDKKCIVANDIKPTSSSIELFTPKAKNKLPLPKVTNSTRNIASPLSTRDPISYGLVFHKILEDSLNAQNLDKMNTHPLIKTLDNKSQARMQDSIKNIIANQEFQKLITKERKTEINLGSNINNAIKIGRIDLMLLDINEVILIDYKSDMLPANDQMNVPENYKQQLRNYQIMAQQLYPKHKIRTMILWLQNGSLLEITPITKPT